MYCCQMLQDIKKAYLAGDKKAPPFVMLNKNDIKDRQAEIDKRVQESKTRFGDKQ